MKSFKNLLWLSDCAYTSPKALNWEFDPNTRSALDALQIRLQGVELPTIGTIPVQLIQAVPYVLTVVLLAGFVGKAIAPNAIGQPYIKER